MYSPNTYQNYYQQPIAAQRQSMVSTPSMYGLKGRPVSSLDEVRATSIDFDGSVFFFPDLANKRIYTKQINADGTAVLNMYELKEIPVQQNMPAGHGDFITRQEFEEALGGLRNSVSAALAQVASPQPQSQAQQNEGVYNF